MGKNPAFQFYPNDWTRDLEEHPLEVEGAWIRICCKLWYSETKGKLTKTVEQWGRILRTDFDQTIRVLKYIQTEKIGKIEQEFTNCNDLVTVISRRMVRDEKEKEMTRLRVERHREKKACNAPVTQMKQRPSSSTSSSSNKKKVHNAKVCYKDFVLLSQDEHKKLLEKFGQDGTDQRIERLNDYLGSTGKKYSSHYFTILNWERMALENGNGKHKDVFEQLKEKWRREDANGEQRANSRLD